MLERAGREGLGPGQGRASITDHYLPANDDESRRIIRIARDWVKEAGVTHFHDGIGICHVVLPQKGHLRPGMFAVGGDSHSPTGGAFGAYMFGIGATEMLGVLVTGEIWLKVPQTILRANGAAGSAAGGVGQGHDARAVRPARPGRRRSTRRSSTAARRSRRCRCRSA